MSKECKRQHNTVTQPEISKRLLRVYELFGMFENESSADLEGRPKQRRLEDKKATR